VAVVLVNFADTPEEPFLAGDVTDVIFGAGDSVASLYDEQSFGLTRVSGEVFGWLTLPGGPAPCDFARWADEAAALLDSDTLSAYTNLLVVFPETAACPWSGLAYVGGATAWINGQPSVRAAAHELGHNLGLGRASALAKGDEYGDPFSVMGSGGTLHLNGVHKLQLGWLAPQNVLEVSQSGVYELAPLGAPSGGPQLLRLVRGSGALVVEYRRGGLRFERFGGPTEPRPGVAVRLAEGPVNTPSSLLIDATPVTDTHGDAIIAAGLELVDLASGTRIRTISASPKGTRVEVAFAGAPGPAVAPASRYPRPGVLVAVATPGERRTRVDLSWSPVAPGAGRPAHYLVLRNGRVVARARKPQLTRFERPGRHHYRVVAVGANGRRGLASRRLVLVTERARTTSALSRPLRGVRARPTRADDIVVSTRGSVSASVAAAGLPRELIPARGKLLLRLDPGRTVLSIRHPARPTARAVRVVAVRVPALTG
jgi:hypothetical protein